MSEEYGRPKSLEDITGRDAIRHPIWVWALDGESVPGQDETWQKPVTSTTSVDARLLERHITLIASFKMAGPPNLIVSGEYDGEKVSALAAWDQGAWRGFSELDFLEYPFEIEAVPTLLGNAHARFLVRSANENAAPPLT